MRFILCLLSLFLFHLAHAGINPTEAQQVDSIQAILDNPNTIDTTRAKSLMELAAYYFHHDPNKAMELCKEAMQISETIDYKDGMGAAYLWVGYLYKQTGIIDKAIEYYFKSLRIREQLNDTYSIALCQNNIAMLYYNQGEMEKALEYNRASLKLRKTIDDPRGLAMSLNNIGGIYRNAENYDSAYYYMNQALQFSLKANDKEGIAVGYSNVGTIFYHREQLDSALYYFKKGYSTDSAMNSFFGLAADLKNLAMVYKKQNKIAAYSKALDEMMYYAQQIGYPELISHAALGQSELAKEKRDFKQALEMYELHITMRDSIKNEQNQKSTIRQQTKYEFEKAQLVAEQQRNEELRIQNEELQRRDNLQYSLILIGVIVLFSLLFALGKFTISPLFAEGLIFFAFLILFEFLLVLGDPFVESVTGGEPIYKLLANAVLAGLIFPLHAFFEKTLKNRIVKSR